MKMYRYIVHDSSTPCEEFLESICGFSHLLIRGLIKGLSTNEGIYSTFAMKMYRYIVHDSSNPWEKLLKSIFRFSDLLIRGLIQYLTKIILELLC